jgi:diguanylate cyclase (GGDEF)-like protein/PAS domain S-box-containing protein
MVLATYVSINQNREYGLYWLSVFPPLAILLLGYRAGSIISVLFFSYFVTFILHQYEFWTAATFNITSIVNIVFTSTFIILFISYFDQSLEKIRHALLEKTIEMEEEKAMLDKYVIVYTLDLEGTITYASNAFYNLSGYLKEDLIGHNHNIIHGEIEPTLFKNISPAVRNNKVWSGEFKSNKKDGSPYWLHITIESIFDTDEKGISYRAIGADITYRKLVEELAVSDHLTKLNNRVKLDEELSKEFLRSERYETDFSVILIDIDYFKNVNDNYGHQKGDHVLKQIAQILKSNIRKVDTVGRWGGEEFLIIASSTTIYSGALLAENLRSIIENHNFGIVSPLTVSIGVAAYQSEDTIDTLIENADKALYRAKKNGRNRIEI